MTDDRRAVRGRRRDRLPPWLSRRLGLDEQPSLKDPAQDRGLIAASLSFLFLTGASVSLAWLLLPHVEASNDAGVLVMTLGAYLTGIVLFIGYDRLPMGVLKGAVTMATIVITGAMYSNHENGSTYVLYYFWATVYAYAFFSIRQAALQTTLVGIGFGLVLYLERDIWESEVSRWLLAMATTLVVGVLVRYLMGNLRQRSAREREARIRAEAAERHTRQIADVLQRSLMPARLPEIPGVELGAAYTPGVAGVDVGGDFYDVFELSGGGWGLVIGDVRGKGAEAASVTALVRYTARAAAVRLSSPSAVLRMVNAALLRDRSEDELCTAIYGRLETSAPIRLRLSIGGHPQPVLLRSGGDAAPVEASGTLLGVLEEPRLCDTEVVLEPGDALVMVTDGVQDSRTSDGRLGEEGLVDLVRGCHGLDAAAIAARIDAAAADVKDGVPGDDVAVLVVRAVPLEGEGSRSERSADQLLTRNITSST